MTQPSYRSMAERSLDQAAQQLNTLPHGPVRTDALLACSAKAQAIATVAVVQALLHLGDVLAGGTATEGDQTPGG